MEIGSAMPARTSASAALPKVRQVRVGAPQPSPTSWACSRHGHSETATDVASPTMWVASSQSRTSTDGSSGRDSSRTSERPIWVLPRKTACAKSSSSYMYSWNRVASSSMGASSRTRMKVNSKKPMTTGASAT